MVKKVCTIMHSLVDDWHPKPCTSRKGKFWRVVIPARLTLTGKQTSKYFVTKADADRFISDQIRNLKRFGTVNGKSIDLDAYKWNAVDAILAEIGVTPLEAATHYVALVKRAGSVAKLSTLIELGLGIAPPDADLSPTLHELAQRVAETKGHNSLVTITSRKTRLYALRQRAGYSPANPWPHDCLRHSFASYSIKAGHDLNQLSADMGHTGFNLLKTRYLNMRGLTRQSATLWWNLTPDHIL